MAGTYEGIKLGINVEYAQVNNAKSALGSLNTAIGKVKSGFSGLKVPTTFPKEINNIDTLTASYIRRLESEGKQYQAVEQQANAYKGAISKLTEQQKQLEKELDQIAQTSGKTSDAYRTQKIRINETATELNHFKAGLNQANNEMRQINPSFADKIKSKLGGLQSKASETKHTFKDMFMGSALGNLASNALSTVTSKVGGAIKEGMELNAVAGKIDARFKGMGVGAGGISKLDNQIKELKYNTNMTGEQVSNVQTRMLNWSTIGQKGAMQISKTIAGIGDTSKLGGKAIEQMAQGLGRVGASGKVTLSSLNRVTKGAPSFYATLAKGAGMSQSHLKQLLATGNVTTKQFQQWMANASKYSNDAFKAFGKTQGGAMKQISSTWSDLKKKMTAPLFNAKSAGLQALKSLLTSKEVTSGATQIGKGIASVVGYLNAHKKDIVGITSDIVKIGVTIGRDLGKDVADIIFNIGKAFGLISGNAKQSANPLHTVKLALDGIAKHPKTMQLIAKAILAIAMVKGLKTVSGGLMDVGLSAYKGYKNVKALRAGFKGLEEVKNFTGAEKAFARLGDIIAHPLANLKALGTGVADIAKTGAGKFSAMKAGGQVLGGKASKVIGAVGTGVVAGGQVISAVQNRHSADKRSQDIGGAVGAVAGGALTSMIPVVGPLLAPVGAEAGKFFGRMGGQAVNNFTKGWQRNKPPKNFWSMENLGWSTKDMFSKVGKWGGQVASNFGKGLNKGKAFVKKNGKELGLTAISPILGVPALLYKNNPKFRKATNDAFKNARNGWNGATKWFKKLGNDTGKNVKSGWNGMKSWASKRKGDMQNGWNGATKWFSKLGKDTSNNTKNGWTGLQKWASNRQKDVQSGWSGATKWFSNLGSNMVKGFQDAFSGLAKWASDMWSKVTAPFNGAINWVKGKIGGGSKGRKVKSHATGGHITSNHVALVGEAGVELAYKSGSHARLLGANGPEITKVKAGEHILNARDTAKVMGGGLGKGLVLKGYASGNTKLSPKINTNSKANTNALNKTTKTITNDYKKIKTDSTKSLNDLSKKSNSLWKNITSKTNKETDKTRKNSISDYTDMRKGVVKQNDKLHDSVIDLAQSTSKGFGKALDKMKSYARDAMSDTIDQLNKGISAIDKVLGQFGGNTAVIKPIKFAKGTDSNGRLTQNTYAMINDAQAGYRQEALVSPNNKVYLPKGDNLQLMIPKGWGVLNGSQTHNLTKNSGVRHFAKGSGVSDSALKKLADNASKAPAKWFDSTFTANVKATGTDLNKGTTGLGNNASTNYGSPWSNAMWTVIQDAIGGATGKGGTREAFLKYAESTFSGVPYLMGAASKTLSDCSGMVMQALRHFGIDIGRTTVAMQESSGVQSLGKNLSKTLPGDLVIFGHGTGSAGHVGIIKNPKTGTMFNETPPHARVTDIASDTGMGYGFYRVKGLHNAVQSKKSNTADKSLISLAKQELGSKAIKWIKDHLGDDFGSLGAFKLGGDIGDRARALAGGLKKLDPRATKNGIAAILGNWSFESTLNPGAVNPSGGASGLGQWLGGRLSNLQAYAKSHGMSWKNPGAQLSFAVKGEGSDSAIFRRILEGKGSVASLANEFSSLWERGGYNAQHVAGAMSIRKALGYRKGGRPKVGDTVVVGENGPELARFDKPVQVYSNEQSQKSLKIGKLPGEKELTPHRRNSGVKVNPVININFNGNTSEKDANKITQAIRRELTKVFDQINEEFGADLSVY